MEEEPEPKAAEVTAAPETDLSLEATEMLLEELASTMLDAEITDIFTLRYEQITYSGGVNDHRSGYESHEVQCDSLKMAMKNAVQMVKSPSINPRSIRVFSQKIITTPPVEHPLEIID
tara:strand:+ start:645 stop:998 length:354 start_codon:yes stop_codon:yes gene_type:complete